MTHTCSDGLEAGDEACRNGVPITLSPVCRLQNRSYKVKHAWSRPNAAVFHLQKRDHARCNGDKEKVSPSCSCDHTPKSCPCDQHASTFPARTLKHKRTGGISLLNLTEIRPADYDMYRARHEPHLTGCANRASLKHASLVIIGKPWRKVRSSARNGGTDRALTQFFRCPFPLFYP
ncbi:hypothetical protein G7K_6740-t1 [Saitoella complicata NRRL Y-17804]|uniref:Uncharacterized protein n=1 Tax=Saitoella complicata (strain BCRC 22490 / CBS 7301 / JCM 7358 / NBRC 10748 / NRRL Y-17804) TaxID=698492 RepID=A0A0E9NSC1_SAICN|nr:hypothetical protein G7K_6740-t1 [Saitoella complicata NRRL Y-17804]